MEHKDVVIVGSGFGGSVSALRLSEKGYDTLVVEKGRRFGPDDFPKTNWNLKRFMWQPELGWLGPFKMTFFRHVTVLSGVGVGGGSLVYANTLPVPRPAFFESGSWAGLRDWETELAPHYDTAKRMLGATRNPHETRPDAVLREVARDIGREEDFHATDVAVYFGEPGVTVEDPYFEGKGPARTGCKLCGACMTGCRHDAKNTLDKNYLYLAEQLGCEVRAETEVVGIHPREEGGYRVVMRRSHGWRRPTSEVTADRVILSGGVMGTMPLLLQMQRDPEGLPQISSRLGEMVRTNNESLIGVTTKDEGDLSKGIAIGSILHTSDHAHVEPVRYGAGSGFFRTMAVPHASGRSLVKRLGRTVKTALKKPGKVLSALTVRDWAKSTAILLYMESLEGTIGFEWSPLLGLRSKLLDAEPPTAYLPHATEIAERVAEKLNGLPMSLFVETAANVPTTAHILGGACIGETPADGVIDHDHQVHGYPGLYVIDGSAMSANPGVNPSLTITAMAERAMSLIPAKADPAPRP